MVLIPNKSPIAGTTVEPLSFSAFVQPGYSALRVFSVEGHGHTGTWIAMSLELLFCGEGLEHIVFSHQLPWAKGVGCWPTVPEAWQGQGVLVGPLRAPAALQPLLLESPSQCDTIHLLRTLPAHKTHHPCTGRCL